MTHYYVMAVLSKCPSLFGIGLIASVPLPPLCCDVAMPQAEGTPSRTPTRRLTAKSPPSRQAAVSDSKAAAVTSGMAMETVSISASDSEAASDILDGHGDPELQSILDECGKAHGHAPETPPGLVRTNMISLGS